MDGQSVTPRRDESDLPGKASRRWTGRPMRAGERHVLAGDRNCTRHAHIVVEDTEDVIHLWFGEAKLDRSWQAEARKTPPRTGRFSHSRRARHCLEHCAR